MSEPFSLGPDCQGSSTCNQPICLNRRPKGHKGSSAGRAQVFNPQAICIQQTHWTLADYDLRLLARQPLNSSGHCTYMKQTRLAVILLLLALVSKASAGPAASGGIGVYTENPFYWEYQGKPVLLLGGSSGPKNALNDEGMFLWPEVASSLDKLVSAGGNYTRCLMSGRLRGQPLWPFLNVEGRFDLDRWDESYWHCFETFLVETKKRAIITDIELWATFDYARLPWTKNPFNPTNNGNYTAQETGLPGEVNSPAYLVQNPFYQTVPNEGKIPAVLKYQKRFVDKILSYTLQFDNVLYCMDNETAGGPTWGAYWANYVRNAATKAGKRVYITEMFESHDLEHASYRNVIDCPQTYDFIEISQNNHQSGQTHFDKIQGVRQRILSLPRPLSNVKIYGSDGSGLFGTSREATERFWRDIFAGCASARFHEKHLGDSELAQRMVRSAREVTSAFDLFHCTPHNELLQGRAPNQAFCLAHPGKEYAVYFPTGGQVQLNTPELEGPPELRWYDIEHGIWAEPGRVEQQRPITLTTPGEGQWAVLVRAARIPR